MNSYKYQLNEALKSLNKLEIDEIQNALWDVLHIAQWHQGIDWVRWLSDNDALVKKLVSYPTLTSCPNDLREKVWDSIRKFKALNK